MISILLYVAAIVFAALYAAELGDYQPLFLGISIATFAAAHLPWDGWYASRRG